ncbi:acetolactate decarboxylase [Marilutibacter chinensis]|uniref:Alpha-acetolactate decarboxylase n=1 Tax=Marilutibacter chinensis TaxID=2912247 RepID=A0ABS9HUB9_9GAMM|nr:acetolactate decarboxylase [Lysobacter chinensis]MCF7221762.1 acetolactate decarboxylase [Lysobacter chinensis]
MTTPPAPERMRHPARRSRHLFAGALLSWLAPWSAFAGQSTAGTGCADADADAVHQFAPAAALGQGRLYEGGTSYAQLLCHGDTGLGAVSPLEGEVIVLDGVAYHADAHGRVRALPPTATTPFAMVKRLRPDQRFELPPVEDFGALARSLDTRIVSPNLFHLARIDGRFAHVRIRSVERQRPPYRSLGEVIASQHVIDLRDVEGSVVGFRMPDYLGGVNAPGWHFHFVDDRRRIGGHLLELDGGPLDVRLDSSRELRLRLPGEAAFDRAGLLPADDGEEDAFRRAIRALPERVE